MGVRQHLKMDKFDWCITIHYMVNEAQKREIVRELQNMGCEGTTLESIQRNLKDAKEDTGFTYSNFDRRCSVIVIHKSSSIGEFINTFEHEKNHVEMHICEALDINPYSE